MKRDGLLGAAASGLGVAFLCATLWYGARALSGSALDVLVFPTALAVALVVRARTSRRGLRVGLLAAALTYVAGALAFVPLLAAVLERDVARAAGAAPSEGVAPTPTAYAVALPLSCVTPVLLAAETPREAGPALAATVLACVGAGALAARERRG